MNLDADQAQALLPQVDPARLYAGCPVGLRDGALLALVAAGFTAVEISGLRASSITMAGGKLQIVVQRRRVLWSATMPVDLGGRVLVWISERRIWGTEEPVFVGVRGPLTPFGIRKILDRHGNHQPSRPTRRRRRRRTP
jgi:hypothetical protein